MSPADRLKTLKAQLAALKARYGATHPDVRKAEREVQGLETQVNADGSANDLLRKLEDARTQLADAKARYSDAHPDVQRLTRVVGEIEQQLATLPAVERVKQARTNPDNPAYIQLKANLESLNAERGVTLKRIEDLERRTGDYQRRVAEAPEVEREYLRLARDYENAQTKYQEVRLKQREAESSQSLETERKGERFTLIEPPLPPEEPISPNRPVLIILGWLASLALAIGAGIFFDSTDPAVRGRGDLAALVEVEPLAVLPIIETREEEAARLARQVPRRRIYLAVLVGLIALVLLLVHLFVRPLDVLFLIAMNRLGFF